MRVLLILFLSLLLSSNVNAQLDIESLDGRKTRDAELAIQALSSQWGTSSSISAPLELGPEAFVFENWESKGEFNLLNGTKFNVQNVNFDVATNQFQSRISDLNYFTFDSEKLSKVDIAGRIFIKKFSTANNGYRFYELLVQTDIFSIYKDFSIKLEPGRVRSGVTDSEVRQSLKTTYYMERENSKVNFRPSLRGLTKIFDDKKDEIKQFVKSQEIKVRTDEDIKRIALHYIQITK